MPSYDGWTTCKIDANLAHRAQKRTDRPKAARNARTDGQAYFFAQERRPIGTMNKLMTTMST